MFLVAVINVVCWLLVYSHNIAKCLSIAKLLSKYRKDNDRSKHTELANARQDLEAIKLSASSGEYIHLVRTMRAEKKVNDIEQEINTENVNKRKKEAFIEVITSYVIKGCMYITLAVISVIYRHTTVMVFDNRFNFAPLTSIISFPAGIPNSISVPVWTISNNMAIQVISMWIKGK